MNDPKLNELAASEFQELMDGLLSEDFDKVTPTEFFGAVAALDEAEVETIELTGRVKDGELVFEQPAPLPVAGSEILVANKRIIIRLLDQAVAS